MKELAVTGVIPLERAAEADVLCAAALASQEANQHLIDRVFLATARERHILGGVAAACWWNVSRCSHRQPIFPCHPWSGQPARGKMHTVFPNPAEEDAKSNLGACPRRHKVAANEHAAKAILPEPQSVKTEIVYQLQDVSINTINSMKQSLHLFVGIMIILLATGGLRAADQSKDMFSDVQQITFLAKGGSKENTIVLSDPGKIQQLVNALHLVKSSRRVCGMEWQVSFIRKAGRVETYVCKHCIEIHAEKGIDRFKTPPTFYKLVQQIEKESDHTGR